MIFNLANNVLFNIKYYNVSICNYLDLLDIKCEDKINILKIKLKKIKLFYDKSLIKYFVFSGFLVILSFLLNLLLIVWTNLNYNYVFIFSFVFFNIISYLINSKYTFKNELSLKKYFTFFQNAFFTWILGVILVNITNKVYSPEKYVLVIIMTVFVSMINLILNLKRTFELKKHSD